MPIYEYRCEACGAQKEFLQRMSDAPLTDCPECGKPALTKLVSAAGFQLKGTGWYVTDFRDKPKPAARTGEKTADAAKTADGGGKESSKAESSSSASAAAAAPAKDTAAKV